MRNRGWLLTPVVTTMLLTAGCKAGTMPNPSETVTETVTQEAVVTEEASEPAADASAVPASGPVGGGRSEKVENDLYEFSYSYPDAAGSIPGLKAELDKQLEQARSELISSSRTDRGEAKKQGFPYHAHSYGEDWKVVADLPGWLSLSSQLYTFTGGAHGMSTFETVLWDRHAETVRKPEDLFVSKAALSKALRTPFCAALDKERGKRRGAPVASGSDEMFSDCIDPVEQVVILGSTNGQTFNRIGLLVPPYNAGPYAEGSYEITLPVTAAVMAALKPQYRASFSLGK
ncbi:uncharacterized protein DUF4163 [Novosphingobium sp. PhB165]|uniref:DUF4163 domain-containing protein n=1 Tax=Novosphingobium sp. PhB165 TaxID=2485105 RepID=UPI0010E0786C|nr:DUF4163 domain-containing protein [Novosphingobium sp. PhB165]TCM19845.1 uncharacterized protein DUF4163 [Novosphingobium sp. PhB165]